MNDLQPSLTWIHISDIHAGQGGSLDFQERRDIMAEVGRDVSALVTDNSLPPQFAVMTGDLTQSGGAISTDEFVELTTFSSALLAEVPVEKLLVVPGNHDCQREVRRGDVASSRRLLKSLRDGAEPIDACIAARDARNDLDRLLRRFQLFDSWVKNTAGVQPWNGPAPLTWEVEWDLGDVLVAIRGVNSAWLSYDDWDQGKLQLGLAQLSGQEARSPTRINILALHHPLSWLRDRDTVEPRVTRDYDIVLSGHMHHPRHATLRPAGLSSVVNLEAGATFRPQSDSWERDGGHAYSFCSMRVTPDNGVRLRVWPRIWDSDHSRFVSDSRLTERNLPYSEEAIRPDAPRGALREIATEPSPRSERGRLRASLADQARESLRKYGRRRTAFPTDLSLNELADGNLLVPPRFVSPPGTARNTSEDALVAQLKRGENVLVLGGPGTGKSVALYGLANRAIRMGLAPIVFRISDLRRLFAVGEEMVSLQERVRNASSSEAPVFFVDGLDEAGVTDGSGAQNLSRWLATLASMAPLAVSCRSVDFERHLAAYVEAVGFETLAQLEPWRVDVEFKSFIDRLFSAGYLTDAAILESVRERPALQRLVTVPLFARMLTLIGPAVSDDITGEEDLYFRFFSALDLRTRASLSGTRCQPSEPIFQLWEEAAWSVSTLNLIRDEAVNLSALVSVLAVSTDGEECARRILDPIVEVGQRVGDREGAFVHYSFYEYLLAGAIVRRLSTEGKAGKAAQFILASDLPRRVRHFVVGRLRAEQRHHVSTLLQQEYKRLRSDAPLLEAQPGCNLISYLLSRSFDSEAILRSLLVGETDDFLRNSLRWGLCHLGALDVAEEFILELDTSQEYLELCRGYLLYYHGDLSRDSEPPYVDGPPLVSWSRTRAAVIRFMAEPSYEEDVPLARRLIDLYTLLSFAQARGERMDVVEVGVIRGVLGASDMAGTPKWVLARLVAIVESVTPGP